jgi:hypothetical protein
VTDDLNKQIALSRIKALQRAVSTARDHYERRAAEQQLAEAQRYLEAIRGSERG